MGDSCSHRFRLYIKSKKPSTNKNDSGRGDGMAQKGSLGASVHGAGSPQKHFSGKGQ